jgi:glycosyltransferase involved in cell wall biosynthesis
LIAIGVDKYKPPIISNLAKDINDRNEKQIIDYRTYVSNEELLDLYQNAKFLVYVSESEAFGLPPIEALGYGCVPIVSDSNITHEIFGENAFFVKNPISTATIAEAMFEALIDSNKRAEIINNSKIITSKFNWIKHTDNILNIFKQIYAQD